MNTCDECKKEIEGECITLTLPAGTIADVPRVWHLHPECRDRRRERAERERAERVRKQEITERIRRFDREFFRACVGADIRGIDLDDFGGWESTSRQPTRDEFRGPLCFPDWPYAAFTNPEFRGRVSPTLLRAFERYAPERDGSLVALGPTGRGKSALAHAWIMRRYLGVRARIEAGETVPHDPMLQFAWVTGYELAGARKRSPLGEESKLVRHAIDVSLLVLDEVGHEPQSEEIMLAIDGRYRERKPTILTSPLEWRKLSEHIGGGAYRRLLEHGQLVDVHGERVELRSVRS